MTYHATNTKTALPQLWQVNPDTPQVFGALFAEVITPNGEVSTPTIPGWELRVWPTARLGDATLEARALAAHLDESDLKAALARVGWSVLGPIRVKS